MNFFIFCFLDAAFASFGVKCPFIHYSPEIVRILKTLEIWGLFLKRIDGFFENKSWFFSEIPKGGKFCVECVSTGIIS